MNNSDLHTEKDLITRFAAGEDAAFTEVYDHFYRSLYFFALRFVTEPEAEDACSEVFVKLWYKRKVFTDLDTISKFLFVLVRNQCFDLIRRQAMKSKKYAELSYMLEGTDERDLRIEQVRADLIGHIYKELEKLPARMREVFLLSFEEGLKPADIAARLNISVQTVSNQKLNAIRLLREALGKQAFVITLLLLLLSFSNLMG